MAGVGGSQAILSSLRDVLAELYPSVQDAQRIGADAGLNVATNSSSMMSTIGMTAQKLRLACLKLLSDMTNCCGGLVLMSQNQAFANLRHILSTLYPDEPSIRRVVNDTGLSSLRIAFSGTAINTWHSVLKETEHTGKVDSLFATVLGEYGGNPKLMQAIDDYRGQGQGTSGSGQNVPRSSPGRGSVIKILFLAANPMDTPRVRSDKQSSAIDEALRSSEFRDRFQLEKHFAVQVSKLTELILRYRPTIVHFTGHGSKTGKIALEDDAGGIRPVSPQALGRLFSVLKDDIRCVVLMACYSEEQAQAIAEHIDCVVGMSDAITDAAATLFASTFYLGLGYGKDVKTAFDLGCVQLELENIPEADIPKLIAIHADPSQIVLVTPTEARK